jgi:hypothetical protein
VKTFLSLRCSAFVARRLRAAARDERGAMVVEVMVGAVVMVMVALGTLSAFDGAAKVGATTKTRALAASLAQEEQERVRGLSVDQLNGLRYSTTQLIGGVTYTIASRTDWLADASSTTSCASNGAAADYLKATTTVTPSKALTKPVVLTTLVTPTVGTFSSTQGSLGVSVKDRSGVGLSNLSVSVTGPSNATDTTDSNGCVFFGYLTAGSYTVAFSKAGFVDKDGDNTISTAGNTVTGDATSTAGFTYDQAASATVNFDTKAYGSASTQTAYAAQANFDNPGIASGRQAFGTAGTYVTSIPASTISTLFPFTDNYSVYAGTGGCAGANTSPVNQIFTAGSTATLTVRVPAINAIISTNSANPGPVGGAGTLTSGARVKATPVGTGCPGAFYLGGPPASQLTNAQGRLDNPGAPYGTYSLCADYNFPTVGWRKANLNAGANVANTAANGTANLAVTIYKYAATSPGNNGSSAGQC